MSTQVTHALLKRFVDGPDRGIDMAGRVEAALAEEFSEDVRFEDFLLALAAYRPGGGDHLYDERAILPLAREALRMLEALSSGSRGRE